jgi:hypothetical protein
VASNSAQAMTSRRQGDTTTVEIGGDERHDITDALFLLRKVRNDSRLSARGSTGKRPSRTSAFRVL